MKTKAAVLEEYQKPLVVEELELSGPKEREVLIEYKASGLCHSDLSVLNGTIKLAGLPVVLGHEGAGIVREVGPGVTRVKPDDHVLLMWVPVCGNCYYCLRGQPYLCADKDKTRAGTMLDGTFRLRKGSQNVYTVMGVSSFSHYNVVSERSVLPIDAAIPFDAASLVGCGVMTGAGAVLNSAKVKRGSTVAVIGLGGVGLNMIQGAVLANATKIIAIDIVERKLEFSKQFGATHVINSSKEDPFERVMQITGGIGVDYAFEAIGKAATAEMCIRIIRRGGTALIGGVAPLEEKLTVLVDDFSQREKNILGTYYGSGDLRVDLYTFLDLYKNGRFKLDELITTRYKLEEINTGFKDMEAGKNARGVVVY